MLDDTILKYCNLDKSIFTANVNIYETRVNFYDKSFTTRTEFTEQGIIVKGANVESDVLNYMTTLEKLEHSQELRIQRYKAFSQYFLDLPMQEQNYVYRRYIELVQVDENKAIERAVLKGIKNIEGGIKQQQKEELTRWVKKVMAADNSKEKSTNDWHKTMVKEHLNAL